MDYTEEDHNIVKWKTLCEKATVREYLPLHTIASWLKDHVAGAGTEITGLDFSGADQMTDDVCFILADTCKELDITAHITYLSLVGCVLLTDNGLKVTANSFPNLKVVYLDACCLLTEVSLFHLTSSCPDLSTVSMSGTSVAIKPQTSVKLNLDGCPLIPQDSALTEDPSPPPHKLFVIGKATFKYDIRDFLCQKDNFKMKPSEMNTLRCTRDLTFDGVDQKINLFECLTSTSLYSAILSPRGVYVIVVDMNTDSGHNPQLAFMNKINNVRAISENNHFILLALHNNEMKQEATERLKDLHKEINEYLSKQMDTINKTVTEFLSSSRTDFEIQQKQAKLKRISKSKNTISVLQVNVDTMVVQQWSKEHKTLPPGYEDEVNQFILAWNQSTREKAYEKLQNLSKSDITELKSFTRPPKLVLLVAEAVLVIFGDKQDWSTFKKKINDLRFISTLMAYDLDNVTTQMLKKLKPYIDNPDLNQESLAKVSVAGVSLWAMVEVVYEYGMVIKPKVQELKKGNSAKPQTDGAFKEGPHLVLQEIQKALKEQELRNQPVPRLVDVSPATAVMDSITALLDQKIVTMETILDKVKDKVTKDARVLRKILMILHEQGQILYLGQRDGTRNIIVCDVQWYMDAATSLYKYRFDPEAPKNTVLHKTIDSNASLFTRDRIKKLLSVNDYQMELLVTSLRDLSILLPVPHRADRKLDPDLLYMFGHMRGANIRTTPDGTYSPVGKYSTRTFNEDIWPPQKHGQYVSTDVQIEMNYGLMNGIVTDLLPRFLSECILLGNVVMAWKTGWIIRCGAIDILFKHNINHLMVASSLDIQVRTTLFDEGSDPSVTQQAMWSVLSPYLTILDAIITQYPLMISVVKVSCLGSCSEGVANTFLATKLQPILGHIPSCKKCSSKGMTAEQMGYLVGRQRFLPFHDFRSLTDVNVGDLDIQLYPSLVDPQEDVEDATVWVCSHCGVSDLAMLKLWRWETCINPAHASVCFKQIEGDESCVSGNLITLQRQETDGSSDKQRILMACPHPLLMSGLEDVHVTVVTPGNIKFILAKPGYFEEEIKQDDDLKHAKVVFDLESGTCSENRDQADSSEKDQDVGGTTEQFACRAGDMFSLHVLGPELVNQHGTMLMLLKVELQKNGEKFYTTHTMYRTIVGVLLTSSEEKEPSVVLQVPSYPMIRVCHFPLGSTVVYHTKVANQWSVKQVVAHNDSLLELQSDPDGAVSTASPDSADLLPLNCFMDGYNLLISKDIIATRDQLKDFLNVRNSWPVAQGVFAATNNITNKKQFSWLKLTKHEPKMCTMNSNSPMVLDMACANSLQDTSQRMQALKASYTHVYLPRGLPDAVLLHPMRHIAHDWNNQEMHFVCNANSQFRDMHFMNMSPLDITDSEIKTVARYYIDSIINSHHCLLHKQKELLPYMKKVLPQVTDLPKDQVVEGLHVLLHIYKSTFILLRRIQEVAVAMRRYGNVKRTLPKSKAFVAYKQSPKAMNAASVQLMQQLYQKVEDNYESSKLVVSKCESHTVEELDHTKICCILTNTTTDSFMEYIQCVTFISVDWQLIQSDAEEKDSGETGEKLTMDTIWKALSKFPSLQILSCLNASSLVGVSQCKMLKSLRAERGTYEELPEEITQLKHTLTSLDISSSPVRELPDFVCELYRLKHLYIRNTLIRSLPQDIGNLKNLNKLLAKETMISDLPESFGKLRKLDHINLNGIPWKCFTHKKNTSTEVTMEHIRKTIIPRYSQFLAFKYLFTLKDWERIFDKVDVREEKRLSGEDIHKLNAEIYHSFPRFGDQQGQDDEFGGFPAALFKCRNLRVLTMTCHSFTAVPDSIQNLPRLNIVNLSQCPKLENVSIQLGKAPLRVLDLTDCSQLKNPPKEMVAQSYKSTVIAYLKRLVQGSVKSSRSKLMFVGLGGAGKTSLMRALMSKDFKAPNMHGEGITDGIDISTWRPNDKLTYSVWDFAGQTIYYNTHQFFMSRRAVYVLVWNTRLGYEHSGLEFWMSSIACHCPESPVFVVGTHADQITNPELPTTSLQKRFPNIQGFYTVSSYSGQGIKEFCNDLLPITMDQPYIGEMIPEAWLSFEKAILGKRTEGSLLMWKTAELMAQKAGIYGAEVKQAVTFLDDMGTLQHFNNQFLRHRIVINPQWIVDVMACVVSVHNKIIQDGRLKHEDIPKIWKNYPKDLYDWLLRLTEVFDLTFPLDEKKENIVPCLLSQTEPPYDWPDIDADNSLIETKMVYKFDYLPAGLFNRCQVRLYQFCDDTTLWKSGSVLKKNDHYCLFKQTSEQRLLVKACGSRPENFLLLVHEILEGLISEFFKGVKYEYQIPCSDCVKTGTTDPAMFSSVILRRAIDEKAFFLQCHTFFHSLPLTEIQSIIPPQSGGDFEIQMQNAVRELGDLEDDMSCDVFFLFCTSNIPQPDDTDIVHPRTIYNDLKKQKISCWYSEDLHTKSPSDIEMSLKNSKVVLVFISDEFVEDPNCQNLFLHIRNRLKKEFVLLMVGRERNWMNSSIGGLITGKVFINFQRIQHYDDKINLLIKTLHEAIGNNKTPLLMPPDVFISYAWVNSASAVKMGHARAKEGSLGHGDPREIKKLLEKKDIPCWIDFERIGRMGRLFHDIAEGLKQSKAVIAFISDEYVMSDNCQMEFRFARVALKKPIIIAVVGTGYKWESTEIGMLALGSPKINFQVNNNTSMQDLLTNVQEIITNAKKGECKDGEEHIATASMGTTVKEKAFQELYEMAQRKFLRQIIQYTEDLEPYPRLFVADFTSDPSTDRNQETEVDGEEISLEIDINRPTFVVDDLRQGQFCLRILCEYEACWHVCKEVYPIELAGEELVQVWELVAPFMARILAILKHSNINLHLINSPEGHKLITMLENKAGVEFNAVLKPIYILLRKYICAKDKDNKRGGLKRCYLPSGKYLWLCEEHQKLPRVTVLEDPSDVVRGDDAELQESAESLLLRGLKKLVSLHRKQPDLENVMSMDQARIQSARGPKERISSRETSTLPKTEVKDEASRAGTLAGAGDGPDKNAVPNGGPNLVSVTAEPKNDCVPTPVRAKVVPDTSHQPEGSIPTAPVKPPPENSQDNQPKPAARPSPTRSTSSKTKLSEKEKARIVKRTSAHTMATMATYEGQVETSRACQIL